ncbi:MAG: vitamin K epoxide reductase family protein, partial [Nannocystaceae bacterium]
MLYQPCLNAGASCVPGLEVSCEQVLTSNLSMVGGLPLSIYGSGFYLGVVLCTLGMLRNSGFLLHVAGPVLLFASCASAFLSGVLAVYSIFVLDAWCPLCGGLYVVSLMLVGLILLELRSPEFVKSWEVWRERRAEAIYLTAVAFIVSVGLASLSWSLATNFVDRNAGCEAPKPKLTFPVAPIVLGSSNPEFTLVVVLDPSCHFCAEEVEVLERLMGEHDITAPQLAIHIHLLPRARSTCIPKEFWPEFTSGAAGTHDACAATLTTYCVAEQRPDAVFA